MLLLLLIESSSMLDKLASCALLLPSLLAAKLSSHLLLKLVEVKVAPWKGPTFSILPGCKPSALGLFHSSLCLLSLVSPWTAPQP